MQSSQISDAEALTVLLTAESLILVVLSAAIAFSQPGRRVSALPLSAFHLGLGAVGLLTIVAAGGLLAWIGVYANHWPCSMRQDFIAVAIMAAIVGQPVFAAVIAKGLKAKK
jgi:hypothetical protein